MARRIGKHTMVYMDFKDRKPVYYVRLGMLETKQFPHGLALATPCATQEEADGFADLVDAYIDEAFCIKSKSQKALSA